MTTHDIHEAQVTFRFAGPFRADIARRLEELLEEVQPQLYGMVDQCIHDSDGGYGSPEDCPDCALPNMPDGDVFIRWAEYVVVDRG